MANEPGRKETNTTQEPPMMVAMPSQEYKQKLISEAHEKAAASNQNESPVEGGIFGMPGAPGRFFNAFGDEVDRAGEPKDAPESEVGP